MTNAKHTEASTHSPNGASTATATATATADADTCSKVLTLGDFVRDSVPSRFLRCSMSRNVKDWMIAEPRVREFVDRQRWTSADEAASEASEQSLEPVNSLSSSCSRIGQILFASGKRKTLLMEFTDIETATAFKNALDQKPWELIQNKTVYIEYVALRQDKQQRDAFDAVVNFPRERAIDAFDQRIPGLLVIKEFLSHDQEKQLLAFLDANDKQNWQTSIKARQVQHFGVAFDYTTQYCDFSRQTPLPPVIKELAERMPKEVMDTPDQITVNEYLPGQGIAAHVDTHSAFTNAIAIVNLENEIVMEFRHPDGRFEPVIMLPRSLVIMTDASRYEWTHAIPPRKFDVIDGDRVDRKRRISITLRKIQVGTPCTCDYPVQCDSQQTRQATISTEDTAAPTVVEKQYVHEFYEKVAGHFSATRYAPWPRVEQFLQNNFTQEDWIADIGCGNGKYMRLVHDKLTIVGGDRSARLCGICQGQGLNVFVGDALRCPLRSQAFDGALSIAVLHHLSTLHHRLEAVKEVIRVLRLGGKGIIYAWAHEQTKDSKRQFDQARQDFMVPWNLDKRYVHQNGTGRETEACVSETSEKSSSSESSKSKSHVKVQRYCHMFKKGELEKLVEMAGNAQVLESYYDESNWAVVLHRTS